MVPAANELKVDELIYLARCWCEASAALKEGNSLSIEKAAELRAYVKSLDAKIDALKRSVNRPRTRKSQRIVRLSTVSNRAAAL